MSRFVDEDLPLVRAARGEAPPLRPVSVRPPFFTYLRQLWERRHFLRRQAWSSTLGRHQGTWLGNTWLIVTPLLDGLVYYLIFGVMFPRARSGIDNFFGYLIIGLFLFSFSSRCLTEATRSIEMNKSLIKAFTFPRASLPIAGVWNAAVGLLPVLYTLIILMLVVPPRGTLSWAWLLLPLVIALQAILNTGLGLILARLGSAIPDLKHVVPYAVRILMFTSCVMWSVERFDAFPEPVPTLVANSPFYILIDMARIILLDGQVPSSMLWIKLSAWAFGSLVFGIVYFWQAEVKYARRAYQ